MGQSSTSNAHVAQIVAASASAIQNAVNATASGQWGTVTIANQLNMDPPGTGDGVMSFSPHVEWDNLHNRMRFLGGLHGNSNNVQRFYLGTYFDSTNSWSPTTPTTMPVSAGTGGAHTYYCWSIDQQTGDVYGNAPFYDNANIRRYRFATDTWDNPLPSGATLWDQGGHFAACAVVYHPGLYGGQGGLLVCNGAGIWSLNLRAATPVWNIILDRTNPLTAMGDFPAAIYDPKTACVYVGGGSATNGGQLNLWKIPASSGAGTPALTAFPPLPWNASPGTTVVSASGNSANNLVLFDRNGNVSEFDGTTWSTVSTTVPAAMLSATNQWWNAGACPIYNCILFPKGAITTVPVTSTTMHFWKR